MGNNCDSTEDIMSEIEELNENVKVEENEKLIVGSLDVKALYPSLDISFSAKVVSEEFILSKVSMDIESIDYRELGLYLVLSVDEKELRDCQLYDYCPTRVSNKGRKPTITG